MFNNILIVCIGNICRSPVAEGVFKAHFADSGKLVQSAGISALVDRNADPKSVQLAADKGIDISAHKARQISRTMLSEADLILVMESSHIEAITRIAPEVRGKTMLLGRWEDGIDIPDPYKKSLEAFKYSIDLIEKSVESWKKYIK